MVINGHDIKAERTLFHVAFGEEGDSGLSVFSVLNAFLCFAEALLDCANRKVRLLFVNEQRRRDAD